jgi:beta-N-acetylhexosaminidase
VELDKVAELVAQPGNVAYGQQIADAAVTLVRDNGRLLPLRRVSAGTAANLNPYLGVEETHNRVVAVIFTDDVRFEHGRVFDRELRARVPDARVFYVDRRIAAAMTPQVAAAVEQAQVVLVPMFVGPMIGNEARNSLDLMGDMNALIKAILQKAGERTAVIALGNPYMVTDFPDVQNYLCTYSFTTVSELSAIRALFGEIAIRGRLPVSIPGVAQRGVGIDRPQQASREGTRFNVKTKTVSAP